MSVSSAELQAKATLLIVDSDERVCRELKRLFEQAGYHALVASDAPTALSALHREPCDLLILDIDLPSVDGLALCRLVRAQTTTKQVPLIIFSARDDEKQRSAAFEAGADDFIVKPSSARDLLSRVSAHLEAARREQTLLGSNRELSFLADLGRSLLRELEPEQVVRRVAGVTYEGTGANLCAAIIKNGETEPIICVFDREGSAEDHRLFQIERFNEWLVKNDKANQAALIDEPEEFFLRDAAHRVEYITPLRFNARTQGAIIVAFDRDEDCGPMEIRLVNAAAQQASLAAHISALYVAARRSSANLAAEVARRTAEAEAQRHFTEAIIDSLPVSLYVIDREHRIVAWNRNRELGGQGIPRDSVIGRNIFDVLTRQRREVLESEFARAFSTGEIELVEQKTTSPDGEVKHWLVRKIPMHNDNGGEVSHVIAVGEDITARVEANRAVTRAERLSSVGRLAAGVVHEINNPLATISACAEALESRFKDDAFDAASNVDDLREYLALIRSEAFRCKTITNGLLDFSRTRAGQRIAVKITDVLARVAHLMLHQRRHDAIEIRLSVDDNTDEVCGDEGQLQQAVIALATNAIDAMPEGGRLTLRARSEDGKVLIEVSDTGIGIASENLTKIFDPFFTTKEVGHGTGLGLAVCYGIVTEHGGRLDVHSAPGAGSTFTISLPAMNLATHNGDKEA
jgi:two-component system NtrC family sensor kinase